MFDAKFSRRRAALLILVVAGAVPAALAGAQDTGTPAPCDSIAIKDAAGDQIVGPILGASPLSGTGTTKGPDNVDITHAFLNTRKGADGKWRTTVNIGIANLNKAVPPQSNTGVVSYTFEFNKNNENILNARARSDGTNVTYLYSVGERFETAAATTERAFEERETTGRFIEGPNGIVEIVLPEAISAPGTAFEDAFIIVSQRDGLPAVGYAFDSAPDDQASAGLALTLAECPAAQDTGGGTSQVPGGAPQTPQAPGGTPTTPPTPTQPSTLPVKAASSLGSAKKAAKKRAVSVRLTASQPVQSLSAQLRDRKGKVVGRGKLAKLSGTATMKLKVGRRIKAGRYTLALTGKLDGRSLTATQAVSLKK